MKTKKVRISGIILALFSIFFLLSISTVLSCSGFMVRSDGNVLVAHNKDWWSPDTYIHVYPAGQDTYARLFFEIPFPHVFNKNYKVLAGGINEHGLCFESFVTPLKLASFELFKPSLFRNPVDHILQHYTTVEEVIGFINSHNLFFLNYILASGQIFVVDRFGDAAIIEGDDIIRIQKDYQICTNFLHSSPELGNYPCWRYQLLTNTLENNSIISIASFESLLSSVQLFTQYSWIFDPNDDIVYLYHFQNFTRRVELNLTKVFNQDAHSYYLPSLFEPVDNRPPEKPMMPIGPSIGIINRKYRFQTNTTDPDNDPNELYYQWDFGDGTRTNWIHNHESYAGLISHRWRRPGTYQVQVKARDIYGKESDWSDPLSIEITRWIHPLLDHMFQLVI